MATSQNFSYPDFATALRTALLSAKASGYLDDSHALHILDNGSELCIFWTAAGITQATWVGYSGDDAVAAQLLELVSSIERSPSIAVNTFNDFMLHGALVPTGNCTLIEFARPVYEMFARGGNSEHPLVQFVGCDILDGSSAINTVLFSTPPNSMEAA